jgi:glycosyltransferase involved in cell wall biosynthesis
VILRQKLDKIELCDRVLFLNPELGHFVRSGTFLPYASVDVASFTAEAPRADRVPRIVHAPSDDAIKGTGLIEDALAEVKSKHEVEVIMVRNKPHAEALALYRDADLAIDQVLTGWYGGFAVEMMAMGKPVLCYIRDEDHRFVPEEMMSELPILRVHPRTLADDILRVLDARSEWAEWSRRARAFVLKWHHPDRIAQALVEAYRRSDSFVDVARFAKA